MTDQEKRIAIAEACGWKRRASTNKDFEFVWMHKDKGYCYALPDYTEDLNAMHEAEMALSTDLRREFREQLCIVCLMEGGPIHASAAQRAQAFLIAIGKL
jgi:hypothetical protein